MKPSYLNTCLFIAILITTLSTSTGSIVNHIVLHKKLDRQPSLAAHKSNSPLSRQKQLFYDSLYTILMENGSNSKHAASRLKMKEKYRQTDRKLENRQPGLLGSSKLGFSSYYPFALILCKIDPKSCQKRQIITKLKIESRKHGIHLLENYAKTDPLAVEIGDK